MLNVIRLRMYGTASEYDDLNSIAIVSFSGETVSKMLEKDDEVKYKNLKN
ncbi:hypothetical protein ONA24_01400 [Mycoplasmopsis cynos]|nr:hypothetical protein [Mycoplasmopsis cynos]WAM09967.1 hypothetical protein ONA24_01400 [Mycoplasmopsis cynos]